MKTIYLRKILSYDPTLNNRYNKYEGYTLSGLQKIQPVLLVDKVDTRLKINSPIFCSSSKRGLQTAKVFQKKLKIKEIKEVNELNEIFFDLNKLLTEAEYNQFGSNLVRERFVAAFVKDTLLEKRSSIKKRVLKVISKLKKLPDGNYLLVSHSFFMKILQAYSKDNTLFENPEKIKRNLKINKKTFNFGEGFSLKLDN